MHVQELQPRVPDVMTDISLRMLALAQVNSNSAHDSKHRMSFAIVKLFMLILCIVCLL